MIHSVPSIDPQPDPSLTELLQAIPSQLQLAFLQRLFDFDRPYPWLTETPETLAYFESLDQELNHLTDALTNDSELEASWQAFSQQLEASWTEPATSLSWQSLYQVLTTQFAETVPADVLKTLAKSAHQVLQSPQSLAERLVDCAQAVLPDWHVDDLHVIARPLAYSLRSASPADTMEVALRSLRFAAWTELSGVEQARLSIAIARYALAQAESSSAAIPS